MDTSTLWRGASIRIEASLPLICYGPLSKGFNSVLPKILPYGLWTPLPGTPTTVCPGRLTEIIWNTERIFSNNQQIFFIFWVVKYIKKMCFISLKPIYVDLKYYHILYKACWSLSNTVILKNKTSFWKCLFILFLLLRNLS